MADAWRDILRAFALTFMSMGTTAIAVGGGLLAFLAIAVARLFRDGWAKGWPVVKSSMGGDAGVGILVAIVVWMVIFLVSLGRAIEERKRIGSVALGAADLYPILDAQLRLANDYASHESRFEQLHSEDDAIRADVNQDKLAIQALTKRLTELSNEIASVVGSEVKTAKGSLALHHTLRNRVLLLVAELREIGSRIKITGESPPHPEERHGRHVPSALLTQWVRDVQDFRGRQTWKQYWDIYHSDFDERVKAIVNDLKQANVASDKLLAFPENLGVDELNHTLPFDVTNQLIPELLSAAEALTKSILPVRSDTKL